MKKIFAFIFAALMVASLSGCGSNNSSSVASQEESAVSSSAESSAVESETVVAGMKEGKTVEGFFAAVDELYGEMSRTPIDDDMLKDLYMIDMENVETYMGETSMINVHAFDVLVVQAKEGKVEDVKATLEERKQARISEFEFYPVNNNDVNTKNALVLTSGDYAILVICHDYDSMQKILDEYFTF